MIKRWFMGGTGTATKQAELEAANAAPYKIEAPQTTAEKIEVATMQNGDLDAPEDLVARAAHIETATVAKPAAMKAKKAAKPKTETTKAPAKTATKPKAPRKPKMSVAK